MTLPILVSMVCALMFNVIGVSMMTDVFVPISDVTCKAAYPVLVPCFFWSKISLYWALMGRLELIVRPTRYQVSAWISYSYRAFSFVILQVLCGLWLYESWIDIEGHSAGPKYHFCFPIRVRNKSLAFHVFELTVYVDMLCGGFVSAMYIYRLFQVSAAIDQQEDTNSLYQLMDDHANKRPFGKSTLSIRSLKHRILQPTSHNARLIKTVRKTAVLALVGQLFFFFFFIAKKYYTFINSLYYVYSKYITATISLASVYLTTTYVLRQVGFFSGVDTVVASLSLMCMFKFSDKFYSHTFGHLEKLCLCICCCGTASSSPAQSKVSVNSPSANSRLKASANRDTFLTVQPQPMHHSTTSQELSLPSIRDSTDTHSNHLEMTSFD
ncbi:hypothetical protein RFI_37092 [Reticulomyxa filosa]|uniref:Uncharacterized protein n=1 Tax=Reticulomyxa filosa TaxID=46433 RepID=X6LI25_RETFI|nr:hypothetical protein RFI_37092 [Reticulomyxa filosa]|eukprot:ETO00355.1 hypothetical protein RFI_37092 [Reticulomyxa filosa]